MAIVSKHLPAIGQGGALSERPLCGGVGEVQADLSTVDCKSCLWHVHMVLMGQLQQVHVRMRIVDAIVLRVPKGKGE